MGYSEIARGVERDERMRLGRYERDLIAFEEWHGMALAEFYRHFLAGELGDDLDWFEWAGLYELKLDLVERIKRLAPGERI